jgi:diguanylate cyclase (GGDEF)-like protein
LRLEGYTLNWSELPDLAAVCLLTGAFASVAKRNQTHVSKVWLIGWVMIALHFGAFLFLNLPGVWATVAMIAGLVSLTWAGLLFMWASVPYRKESSSRHILIGLMAVNGIYISVLMAIPANHWALTAAASLFGLTPLILALVSLRQFYHPLRWLVVGLYSALSIFLFAFQNRSGNGQDLALNSVLFTVYLGCCVHFWYAYRRGTAGAFVTITGFLAWAFVFVIAPSIANFFPASHIEDEVWNLPKYLVAVGMILILLEDQLQHNTHLALHDHLTGLPNRRLYQDRLSSALERARRSAAQTALLVVDLDGFKRVNDTLGHHVGDLVLVRVAELFEGRVRRSDTVARTGGDEFSIILEEPTSRAEAAHVGLSLVHLLEAPLEIGQHRVRIGASVGIAIFPEDARDLEALCIAADLRMYDKKHGIGQQLAGRSYSSPVRVASMEPALQSNLQPVE